MSYRTASEVDLVQTNNHTLSPLPFPATPKEHSSSLQFPEPFLQPELESLHEICSESEPVVFNEYHLLTVSVSLVPFLGTVCDTASQNTFWCRDV